MQASKRPVLRAPGGKFRIADWIASHRPAKYGWYVEPYCFSAAVLFAMPKKYGSEIINDINNRVTDLFKVLRDDEMSARLEKLLRDTPYSYTEYKETFRLPPTDDMVENSRRMIFQSFVTIGMDGITRKDSGFRRLKNHESFSTGALEWGRYPDYIGMFRDRLKGVVIENMKALELIRIYDTPETFFYLDPPYPMDVRSRGRPYYENEMTWEDHVELAEALNKIKGMAIISSYDTPEYRALFPTWRMDWKGARTMGNFPRVEAIWMSPNIANQLSF